MRGAPPAAGRPAAAFAAVVLLGAAGSPAVVAAQESVADPPADTALGPAADPAAVAPDDARVDSLTARVSDQLRCPVCRSQSVLESSSDLANRMQSVIRERLARGESPAEVRSYFVDKYGEWILLKPPARGINLLVYVLPALALLGGGWAVARWLRRGSTEGTAGVASGSGGDGTARSGERDGAGAGAGTGSDDLDLPEEDRQWLERELRDRD